ncbi:hypothetical protein A6R70_23805 [Agrobacterium rubi]|nr:hypothetical protein [Agrobacterium rubi]
MKSINSDRGILEIGPFTKPAFSGEAVRFFDVLNKSSLLKRAAEVGYPTNDCPDIDYVSEKGDLSIVPSESFCDVFSSHCIEHQPDLVAHLEHVSRILKEGGRYYLIIPDKRFCFDHFLPESDLSEVKRAHCEGRKVHTQKSIFEHYALTTHSRPLDHWAGDHGDPNESNRFERARSAIETHHNAAGAYVDVHAWQFTPSSFRTLISALSREGIITLDVLRVYETVWGQYEFCAVLEKTG